MNISDIAKKISAVLGLCATLFAGFFFLDARHASVKSVAKLEKRVSLQELRRLLREAEEEMYHYRKLHRKYPDDQEIKERLEEAEERVADLKERIKKREDEGEE